MSIFGGKEKFQPVPLEEVKSWVMINSGEHGKPVKKDIGWNDLNPLEQNLVRLVLDGKYGEACNLAGNGKSTSYSKDILNNFLESVAEQNNKTLKWALTNHNVRNITGQ
jgi:hypothetical protein